MLAEEEERAVDPEALAGAEHASRNGNREAERDDGGGAGGGSTSSDDDDRDGVTPTPVPGGTGEPHA
jgi:hypothetical protein